MIGLKGSIRNARSPNRPVALLCLLLVVVALGIAYLVAEGGPPPLPGAADSRVRTGYMLFVGILAAPVVFTIVRTAVRSGEGERQLAILDKLLSAAHHYARQGYWEINIGSGELTLSDNLHLLLGDPGKTLKLTLPLLREMANPEDRDRLGVAFHQMLEGSQEQLECRITGLDGKERTFWFTGARGAGRGRPAAKAYGIAQDITERKVIEAALRESEDHYRHAVELSPLIPWIEDAEGNTLELSSRWFELTGSPVEASLGKGWTNAIHPDDLQNTERVWQEALRTGEAYDDEHRVLIADGTYRWFRSRASARRNDKGKVIRWYGTVEDIHDRKVAEIALRESEAFASSILESTTDCVRVLDLEGRLQYMNPPGRLAWEIDDLGSCLGVDWAGLWPESERPKLLNALAVARGGGLGRFTGFCPTAKGAPKWWDVCVSPIAGPHGHPARLLATSRDVTASKLGQDELERARKAAEYSARHDSLTGLPNRAFFRAHLEQEIGRTTSEAQTALLFLDLDEFKSVNDSLGHPAGDWLLQQAAKRLATCLRDSDLVARFGGDEFAIMQVNVKSNEDIASLAHRVIETLSAPYDVDGSEVVVGVSVGIALASLPEVSADDLLKRADIALYEAKHAGRGTHRFFEPGLEAAAEEAQRLRADLHDALRKGEFRIYYQPVVEFGTFRVTGFEALLRWHHPRRGLVGPAEFIPLAEATGAIEDIGAWVLREACSLASTWPGDLTVSVNLSPRQFRARCLAESVSQALSASGLAPERLQLEITESVLLQDDEVVRSILAQVRALGVRISIDDFGTGYSSLGYLRRFSVDNIKIDRSFVADLSDNPRTSAILRAVMTLGADLGVSLTAEGIEDHAQVDQLKAMGCHLGQGYLFSHPVPEDEVARLIGRPLGAKLIERRRLPFHLVAE